MADFNRDQILFEANRASLDGRWEDAESLYQQILDTAPDHNDAQRGLERIQQGRGAEERIRELDQLGDRHFTAHKFEDAAQVYGSALDLAVNHTLPRYQWRLTSKLWRARELGDLVRAVADLDQRVRQAIAQPGASLEPLLDELNVQMAWIPPGDDYHAARAVLAAARSQIEGLLDPQALYRRAIEAIRQADFVEAARIAQLIPADWERAHDAQRIREQAQQVMERDQPVLDRAEAAHRAGDSTTALAELDLIRHEFAEHFAAQQLWWHIHIDRGNAELDAGWDAALRQEYDSAGIHFELAYQQFKQAQQADYMPEMVQRLQAYAADLVALVGYARRAEADHAAGRLEEALASLTTAMQRIERAKVDPHDFAAIAASLRLSFSAIEAEQKRIETEERQIRDAERWLADRRLDQALQGFSELRSAYLPAVRQRVEDGLRKAEDARRMFDEAMAEGKSASDSTQVVAAFQHAYELWPAGPDARQLLLTTLIDTGAARLAAGQDETALDYFHRALQLDPDNRSARAGLQKPTLARRIDALIREVRADLAALGLRERVQLDDFIILQTKLRVALEETEGFPELQREVTALLEELNAYQEDWRIQAAAMQSAQEWRLAGDWDTATRELEALASRQDVGPHVRQQLSAWQAAQRAVAAAQPMIEDLFAQADAAYRAAAAPDEFRAVLNFLDRADQQFALADRATSAANGPPASALRPRREETAALRRRVDAAVAALTAPTLQESLSGIREARRLLDQNDPVLRRLQERIEEQQRAQIPELLRRAQAAESQDRYEEALALLGQVLEIDPQQPDVQVSVANMRRRQEVDAVLSKTEVAVRVAGESASGKRDALRRGLNAFLRPELVTLPEIRAVLGELTRLADENSGEALAEEANWQRALELQEQLRSQDEWIAHRAARLVDEWLPIARNAAIRGAISSSAASGEALKSYSLAYEYRRLHPDDDSALVELTKAQGLLLNSLRDGANRQLSRAQDALNAGEFDVAKEHLDRLQRDSYDSVDSKFPHLLDTFDEDGAISRARSEADLLQRKAEELASQSAEVKAALEDARQSFLDRDFLQAEQALDRITGLDAFPKLHQQVKELRAAVASGRAQAARKTLNEQLASAEMALKLASTPEQLDGVLPRLEAIMRDSDWLVLSTDDRNQCDRLIREVREKREAFAASVAFEAAAELALMAGDLEGAARALLKAIETSGDPGKKARLQLEYEALDARLRAQHSQDEALRRGRSCLTLGDYTQALHEFARVSGAEDDVGALRDAARAGLLLQKIRSIWEGRRDLESALSDMYLAQELVKDNKEARDIAREIAFFHEQLRQRIASIQNDLRDARAAMDSDQHALAEEKVRSVLSWDVAHPEALRLQSDIQARVTARATEAEFQQLMQAALERREQGDDEGAIKYLNKALLLRPGDEPALARLTETQAASRANEAVRQARSLAYKGQFQAARSLLDEDVQRLATPTLLSGVNRLLSELENSFRANTIYPIRDLLREDLYREALQRCQDALRQNESPDFQPDLVDLQNTIVKRWVDRQVAVAQERLKTANEEEIFHEIAADLQALRDELADFSASKQLEQQLRQVQAARLSQRLAALDAFRQMHLGPDAEQEASSAQVTGRPLTLQEAQEWARSVVQEANQLALGRLLSRALVLEMEFGERIEAERKRQDQQMRAGQLDRARELLTHLAERHTIEQAQEDLAEASRIVDAVLAIADFHEDREAVQLLEQISETTAALQQSQQTFKQVHEALAQAHVEQARRRLRQAPVGHPLVQARHASLVRLAETLRSAERSANRGQWRDALAKYRDAAQQEPNFEWLEEKLAYCQRQIAEEVLPAVSDALRAMPPDPARARSILEEAETSGWLDATADAEIARLRSWIASQERVAEAIGLLTLDHAHPQQAMTILRDARRIAQVMEADVQITQWEQMAQALQFYLSEDLDAAEQMLSEIGPPVNTTPQLRAVQQAVQQARAVAEAVQEARAQVESALAAKPPQPELVARAVRRAADLFADSPRVVQLQREARARLLLLLEETRQDEAYTTLDEIGKVLRRLFPQDAEVVRLVDALSEERASLLLAAIQQTQQALQTDQLAQAMAGLSRARKIAGTDDETLSTLSRQLEQRREIVQQVDSLLQETRALSLRAAWDDVVEQLEKARDAAPAYAAVGEAVAELQDQLANQATAAMARQEFAEADRLCELGLRLGATDELAAVQRMAHKQREQFLAELRQQALVALECWDIVAAEPVIARGLKLAADDAALQQLRTRSAAIEQLAPALRQQMAEGWYIWERRLQGGATASTIDTLLQSYQAAELAFTQVLQIDRLFREAELWSNYSQAMEQGIQAVSSERFEQAALTLERADAILRIRPDEKLPALLGSQEHQIVRRRQAIYDAWRLLGAARALAAAFQFLRESEQRDDEAAALEAIGRVLKQKQAFLELCRTVVVPPLDFQIWQPADTYQPDQAVSLVNP